MNSSSGYWEQNTGSTDPSKNWSWVENGSDGAHAFASSNLYYTIDYKGYPDPVIKASGSTYYIDYGAVDMNGLSSSTTGIHLQENPDCTELPCPAGTTNQGTYYNHTAASAGAGLGAENTIVIDSICPSGWMLPAVGATENKSLYSLIISAYGGRVVSSGGTNADVIVLYPPLSFLRGGMYHYTRTMIVNPGMEGDYWQNKTNTNLNAYEGYFNTRLFKIDYGAARGYGYSIRCVSRS